MPGKTPKKSIDKRTGNSAIAAARIEHAILVIRGERVIIDCDLADLYGVPTKRLNEQVKRNSERFPADFMFQLTDDEKEEVVANCDRLRSLKFSPPPPRAFTEHGAIMAANVLKSKQAVETSILVVRAFVRMRKTLASTANLARKLAALEQQYDARFAIVFDAIRELMEPVEKPKEGKIGFRGK